MERVFEEERINQVKLGAEPPDDLARDYCELPVLDLTQAKRGQVMAGAVPFEIDRAISLGCHRRPPMLLPLAVNGIEIGRALSALYFLHPGPVQMGAQKYWRYLVRYADGVEVEVIPVGERRDLYYRQHYFLDKDQALEEAFSVEPPWNPICSAVHRDKIVKNAPTELDSGTAVFCWANSRPEVAVQTVDFRSMDAGQAVLLALTAAMCD